MEQDKKITVKKVFQYIFLALTVLGVFFIIYFASKNGDKSAEQSGRLTNFVCKIIDGIFKTSLDKSKVDPILRKTVGHFGLFLFTGLNANLFAFLTVKSKLWFYIQSYINLTFGLLLAMLSEFIQSLVPNRGASWSDVSLDFLGFFVGVIISIIIALIIKLIKEKKNI